MKCVQQPQIVVRDSSGELVARGYTDAAARLWSLGASLILILAAVLRVGEQGRVYLPGASAPIVETCLTQRYLGLDCAGCGLTRAFIHMMRGEATKAARLNPVGIAAFLFTSLQVGLGVCQLYWRRPITWIRAWPTWNQCGLTALGIGLACQWLIRTGLGWVF